MLLKRVIIAASVLVAMLTAGTPSARARVTVSVRYSQQTVIFGGVLSVCVGWAVYESRLAPRQIPTAFFTIDKQRLRAGIPLPEISTIDGEKNQWQIPIFRCNF